MEHFFEEEFKEKVLDSKIPVLMDFYTDWCSSCRAISPFMETAAEKYKDKLKVIKVDCDECENLAADFEIRTIPTLIMMNEGEEVGRCVGGLTRQKIDKFINKNLN